MHTKSATIYSVLMGLLFIFYSLFPLTIYAQTEKYDTLQGYYSLTDTTNFSDSTENTGYPTFRIFSNKYVTGEKIFSIGAIVSEIARRIDKENKVYKERDSFFVRRPLIFRNLKIVGPRSDPEDFRQDWGTLQPYKKPFFYKEAVLIKNCSSSGLYLDNSAFEKRIEINDNKIPHIQIENSNGLAYMMDNINTVMIYVADCNPIHIYETGNAFDTSIITYSDFTNSIINGYTNDNNSFKNHEIKFTSDSLSGKIRFGEKVMGPQPSPSGDTLDIEFRNTHINSPLPILRLAKFQRIYFNECTFGPNAEIIDILGDEVHFINCNQLPSTTTLLLTPNTKKLKLELTNSNLGGSRFVMNGDIELLFPDGTKKDNITNTYESLLNKFKTEGKFESYKELDIQYKKELAKRGNIFEKALSIVNNIWWNYGYSKSRVILWTFTFLILFFVMNVIFWERIQSVYPMNEENIIKNKLTFLNKIRYYASIFFYTALIFFSLRIDFDRLKFSSTRIVALFLLQYIAGIICLLFITSAILKF